MSERVRGTVKWFNDEKGYGFIGQEGGPDVFVHYKGIRKEPGAGGFRTLSEGQLVEFSVVEGRNQRPAAEDVTKVPTQEKT